eukprot:9996-Rhodomonas_salina.1
MVQKHAGILGARAMCGAEVGRAMGCVEVIVQCAGLAHPWICDAIAELRCSVAVNCASEAASSGLSSWYGHPMLLCASYRVSGTDCLCSHAPPTTACPVLIVYAPMHLRPPHAQY